jgi:hypothetical protein
MLGLFDENLLDVDVLDTNVAMVPLPHVWLPSMATKLQSFSMSMQSKILTIWALAH